MTVGPGILALDFDGVLCDGMAEYFESSRRTCSRVWPDTTPGDEVFPDFRELRPEVKTGWEMPVLLHALGSDAPKTRFHADWDAARDELMARDPRGHDTLAKLLEQTLDQVRRDWISSDRAGWLAQNKLYSDVADVRRLVSAPDRTAIVTTKEGQFCRWLLEDWAIEVADIQGKEAGTHKCDNLRALRAKYETETGKKLTIWFVEDRLKTLQCVRTHPDLQDVGLFLAEWGYVTEATKAEARASAGVKVLRLAEFTGPFSSWGGG